MIMYHPLFKSVRTVLYKHLTYYIWIKNLKKVFHVAPIVSFISAQKLRAKLYPLQRTVVSFKCKKTRCEVCINIIETETFTSAATEESFKINHKFNRDDKCLIYFLTCNQCKKQNAGETVDSFRFRWNNYKCNSHNHRKDELVKQQDLCDHFMLDDHTQFVNDVSRVFIDKTDPINLVPRAIFRLERFNYFRRALHLGCLISSSCATAYLTTFSQAVFSGVTITGTSEI